MADRIVVLNAGAHRADRLAARTLQSPRQPLRRRLSRLAAHEFLQGASGRQSTPDAIAVALGGTAADVAACRLPATFGAAPAATSLSASARKPSQEAPDGVAIEATVKVVESLGRETLLYVDAGPLATTGSESQEGYIAVHRPSQETVAYGSPLRLAIDPRDVFVFAPDGPTLRYPGAATRHRLKFHGRNRGHRQNSCVTDRSIWTSTPPSEFPASARASTPRISRARCRGRDVDSVTVFSKCHHGWSYHPTKVGKQHPNLDFDLLRAQIDALHGAGINAPVYLSAGWDELAAREHPGWRVVTPEGVLVRQRGEPLGPGWAFLDFNSPYLDYLCRAGRGGDGALPRRRRHLHRHLLRARHGQHLGAGQDGGRRARLDQPRRPAEIHRADADRVLRARQQGACASTIRKCRSSSISVTSAAAGATS